MKFNLNICTIQTIQGKLHQIPDKYNKSRLPDFLSSYGGFSQKYPSVFSHIIKELNKLAKTGKAGVDIIHHHSDSQLSAFLCKPLPTVFRFVYPFLNCSLQQEAAGLNLLYL